ncbi:hypothetical protein [Oleisolibacter albus]|uniref:hypothetical protein n=1 Tax=Oleisolibacter albus TaxID=2171757 RepID=UPI000DF2E604|nr:hypothetical protein [Oleisolibacter albus]
MRPIPLLPALLGLLLAGTAQAARAQDLCPDPDMAAQEGALKAVHITRPAPDQSLQGTRSQPARDGGTWFVSLWRRCPPDKSGADQDGLTLTLHHAAAGGGPATEVATGLLPDQVGGAPADPPVLDQGKDTLVLADVWNGGNCAGCEHVAVLAVDGRSLTEIAPPRDVVVNNLDTGSGTEPMPPTLLGFDPRWTGFADLPTALAPSSTIRLELKDRIWVERCTAAREDYLGSAFEQAEMLDSLLAEPSEDGGAEAFSLALSIVLDELNAGQPAKEVLAALDRRLTAQKADRRRWSAGFQHAAAQLRQALQNAAASGALDRGCPALGLPRP